MWHHDTLVTCFQLSPTTCEPSKAIYLSGKSQSNWFHCVKYHSKLYLVCMAKLWISSTCARDLKQNDKTDMIYTEKDLK